MTPSITRTLDILDIGLIDVRRLRVGQINKESVMRRGLHKEAGRCHVRGDRCHCFGAAEQGIDARGGHEFEGQTQILAELTGSQRYGMILLLGKMRVMMLTTIAPCARRATP